MPDNDLQLTFGADAAASPRAWVRPAPPSPTRPKGRGAPQGLVSGDLAEQLKQTLGGVQALAKGLQSADAAGAQQKITEANAKGIEDRARDAQKGLVEDLSASKAVLAAKIAAIQEAAAAGAISASQESAQIARLREQAIQDELDAANRSYQIQQGALDKRLALYAKDSPAFEAVLDKEAALANQYSDEITKIKANALKQQDDAAAADLVKLKQEWDGAVNPLVSSFTSGLMQMAEGTKSFAQEMRSFGQQIHQRLPDPSHHPMIEKWLVEEGQQTAATFLGLTQRATAESVAVSAGQGQAIAQPW
ncbi:MAG: hypothetical protein WDM85_05955 [Caulobacteraceae bacterium]